MHFVDEHERLMPVRAMDLRGLDGFADVLHAREHRGQRDELARRSASAIRRASVVLPTPGGPQRIIECASPDSNATRNGLLGAEQVLLADHVVDRAGTQALGERDDWHGFLRT